MISPWAWFKATPRHALQLVLWNCQAYFLSSVTVMLVEGEQLSKRSTSIVSAHCLLIRPARATSAEW